MLGIRVTSAVKERDDAATARGVTEKKLDEAGTVVNQLKGQLTSTEKRLVEWERSATQLKGRLASTEKELDEAEKSAAELRIRVASGEKTREELSGVLRSTQNKLADTEGLRAQIECNVRATDEYDSQAPEARRLGVDSKDWKESLVREAIDACRQAYAHSKSPRHQFQLGRAMLAAKDREAIPTLELAANRGYRAAMTLLGLAYRDGVGTPSDIDKARFWYAKAVNGNDAAALYQYGYMLAKDPRIVGEETRAKALDFYTRAAAERFGLAHAKLSRLYLLGEVDGIRAKPDCSRAKEQALKFVEKLRISENKVATDLVRTLLNSTNCK